MELFKRTVGAEWQIELDRVLSAMDEVLRMLREAEDQGLNCEILHFKLKHLQAAAAAFRARDLEAGRVHVRLALGS
jgi:hypothetical protein